ncbi:hypothetical protein V2I01_12365 [Micromonospora sp. BRA006-A]|nr:hypothetical protein [Micromonospora sp. BRA006-A]
MTMLSATTRPLKITTWDDWRTEIHDLVRRMPSPLPGERDRPRRRDRPSTSPGSGRTRRPTRSGHMTRRRDGSSPSTPTRAAPAGRWRWRTSLDPRRQRQAGARRRLGPESPACRASSRRSSTGTRWRAPAGDRPDPGVRVGDHHR